MADEKQRLFVEGEVKLRSSEDGKATMITGEAIVFERESLPIYGEYIEVIKRGALRNTDMSDVIARTNHDSRLLLGTSKAQTLRLMETASGLSYEVDIPDTTAGRDTQEYIKRGDIAGSSFAFIEDRSTSKWIDRSKDGMLPLLEIYDIKSLHDVSPVTSPAYPDAKSALRSFQEWKQGQSEAEQRQKQEEENLKANSDSLLAIHKHKLIKR